MVGEGGGSEPLTFPRSAGRCSALGPPVKIPEAKNVEANLASNKSQGRKRPAPPGGFLEGMNY